MSCDRVGCDDMGCEAVWLYGIYMIWLCSKHIKELLNIDEDKNININKPELDPTELGIFP